MCSTSRTSASLRRNALGQARCPVVLPPRRLAQMCDRAARSARCHPDAAPHPAGASDLPTPRSLYPPSVIASAVPTSSVSPAPLHSTFLLPPPFPVCRAPARSSLSAVARDERVSLAPLSDHCASRTTDARPADILASVVVSSFLSHVYANAWRRLPCFFDWRTLPVRRGASKRSRLDDHGPQRVPPRSPIRPRTAFLTRRLFRAGRPYAIENRTPSPGGTHKEKLQ
jgi:hypothetical protein